MAKLLAKATIGVGAIPGKLVGWAANSIAQTADVMSSEAARREAAIAFAKNEPLPYLQMKSQLREARLASIRYRILHNPIQSLPAAEGQDQGNGLLYTCKIMAALAFVYLLSEFLFPTLGPNTLISDLHRRERVTLPFDRQDLETIQAARGGGHH